MNRETKLDIIEMGRGYLGVLLLAILMATGVVSGMYAGDSVSFETNFTNPVYTVTGNQSSLEGLNVTFENGNITISPALNYKPDNFTIIFFDNITNEIIKEVNIGGSGSRRTVYVDKNVTVYVPEYININTIEEVEVEKIVNNTTVIETGYELWHILLGLSLGVGFGCFMMWKKKEKTAEKIIEEIGDDKTQD